LTLVRHDFVPAGHRNHAVLFKPRRVAVVKATKVGLAVEGRTEPSWLEINRASEFRFGGDEVTVDLTGKGDFAKVMVYKLSTPEGTQEHAETA
jgi:hypothetical protein